MLENIISTNVHFSAKDRHRLAVIGGKDYPAEIGALDYLGKEGPERQRLYFFLRLETGPCTREEITAAVRTVFGWSCRINFFSGSCDSIEERILIQTRDLDEESLSEPERFTKKMAKEFAEALALRHSIKERRKTVDEMA